MSDINGNRQRFREVEEEEEAFLMGQLAQCKGDHFNMLGRKKEARGEYLAAIAYYDRVLPDSPDFIEAHKCKESTIKNIGEPESPDNTTNYSSEAVLPNHIPNDVVQPQGEKQHWEKRRMNFNTWAFSFVFTTVVMLVATAINETIIPEFNALSSGDQFDDILSPPISFSPIAINRDLPGFNKKAYFVPPPSDLRKYSQGNYLKLIGLSSNLLNQRDPRDILESAPPEISLSGVRFQKREILIGRNMYTSVFDVELYKNDERRIIFSLDGTQQAALLQFGLEYPSSRSICNGDYRVEIIADKELLWVSKCEPGQENEIFSVPLSIAGKETLTINITSHWEDDLENQDVLVFTQALILKN